jgi:non-ribosomal peptide synthetase component E (peptide arylation enzyme)
MPEATWQAILALHARYPRQLERLKDGWWEDNSHAETLTALASWRAELDATPDHRQELSYQHQLHSYASQLRSEPGGTASLWKPQVE